MSDCTAAAAIFFTGLGGIAEVTGFVKLSAELRRARGGDEYGPLRRRFHNWKLRRKGLAREGSSRVTGVGQTISVGTAVENDLASAIIVGAIPPPSDTPESMFAHLDARLKKVEVQREVMQHDQTHTTRRLEGTVAHVGDQLQSTQDQLRAALTEAREADAAESQARAWFISGVVLATIGGVVGNV